MLTTQNRNPSVLFKPRFVLSILLLCSFCVNVIGQTPTSSITAGWFTFLSAQQEFIPTTSFPANVNIRSANIVSYAGSLAFNQYLDERFEGSIGLVVGAYPTDFIIKFDSSFSIFNSTYDDYFYNRYSMQYLGFNIGMKYYQPIAERHFLSTGFKVNSIFVIPQFYNTTFFYATDKNIFKMFETRGKMNPNGKVFFAPEINFGYHYKLNKYFMPFISLNGVYSNNYPTQGHDFTLFGKNQNVTGTFKHRFLQAGVEVGVKVGLPAGLEKK